jgi:quinoprotein glucose dehydrogenase
MFVVGGVVPALRAQDTRSVWDGVYSEGQATRGAALYDRECASCHGAPAIGGSMAGALAGPAFSANWDGQTVGDLFDRNRTTMPVGREGKLSASENADITAFLLQANGFPAGGSDLPAQGAALKQIQYFAVKPHQDNTPGSEWIRRLERPERIPGLRIDDVIRSLRLGPDTVVADIGAGTGAFTIAFARAVAPSGRALAVDIWPELLAHIEHKARLAGVANLDTVLAERDNPRLPSGSVDVVFFHDVFHNVNDREAYLRTLAPMLKPDGRVAIVEQEYHDPIAKKWDKPEDRITREQVQAWMTAVGFELEAEFDFFKGSNNPAGTGMPERWFVVYARQRAASSVTAH